MLSQSFQRSAAVSASTDTALAFCVKHGLDQQLAQGLASAIGTAVHNLAASSAYSVMTVPISPGAEAEASAANGCYPIFGLPAPGLDPSPAITTTATACTFDIYDAEDDMWHHPNADSADVAAGASTGLVEHSLGAAACLKCAHPEPLPSTVGICGGGTSVTTLKPVAVEASLAAEPYDVIPGSLQHDSLAFLAMSFPCE